MDSIHPTPPRIKGLTVMVEPRRYPQSDQDVRRDESSQIWSCLGGLVLAVGLGVFLLIPAVKERMKAARAEAQWQAGMDLEKKEFRELLQEMKRGNAEQRRIAAEIEAFKRGQK